MSARLLRVVVGVCSPLKMSSRVLQTGGGARSVLHQWPLLRYAACGCLCLVRCVCEREALLHMVWDFSLHCYVAPCMQMRAPDLAGSLWRACSEHCMRITVDALDIDSGWQQSKSIRALSAEVGQTLRILGVTLWQHQAA